MKHRTYLKCLFAVLPVVTFLRILQMLFTINPEDGFNYAKYAGITQICNGVLALLCVAFFIVGLFLKQPYEMTHTIKGTPMAAVSFLMSLGVIVQAVSKVLSLSGKLTGVTVAAIVLDIIMGILFFSMGFSCIAGRKISGVVPVSALIWSVAEMVLYYTSFNGVTMNSENVFNLMAMCTAMLFWLYFAHICTGYQSERSSKYAFVFGSVACMFCVLCTVARLFILAIGRNEVLNTSSTVDAVNISTAVFIITFLCTLVPSVEMAIKKRARRSFASKHEHSAKAIRNKRLADEDEYSRFKEEYYRSKTENLNDSDNEKSAEPYNSANEADEAPDSITEKEQ